jgi:hypothetical protein
MSAGTKERMINVIAGAGLAAIMFSVGVTLVCMWTEETA